MRVKVKQRNYLNDLIAFLQGCGCVVEQVAADEIKVAAPVASTPGDARERIIAYLAWWRARAATVAEIVD